MIDIEHRQVVERCEIVRMVLKPCTFANGEGFFIAEPRFALLVLQRVDAAQVLQREQHLGMVRAQRVRLAQHRPLSEEFGRGIVF